MSNRAQYQTRQMTELVGYLRSIQGTHVTVNDICMHFKSKGITVGTTTIYRHLEKMVLEGTVHKYILESGDSACFEYVGDSHEDHEPSCFHCKCEECGKLIHLHCEELAGIREHLISDHGFRLDSHRTVFYGLCENCQAKRS